MEALTAVTGTFMFPISDTEIFVAKDTEAKRNEYEPNILLTFPLPNAVDQKDLIDAANSVRAILNARTVGWDSVNRIVMIRDRAGRARLARGLLESLLLPKAQFAIEIQILTVDSSVAYHYGLQLPTSTNAAYLSKIFDFQRIIPASLNGMTFLAFGGGASLFGITLGSSNFFATYSESFSRTLYDATVAVGNGQTANLHIGDKYPIAQSLYSGATQQTNSSALYNPIGQVSLEDLGIILKITPRLTSSDGVSMDVEASYRALGPLTIESVPEILERGFKGTVSMREGQWAVLGGLDEQTRSVNRSGIAGLADIPGINQLFSENTRNTEKSKTLLVLKPKITRAPMSSYISPQFLLGPVRGERVVM
jgi:general secretion pathway protein D